MDRELFNSSNEQRCINVEITVYVFIMIWRKKKTEDGKFDEKFPHVYSEVKKHFFHNANEHKENVLVFGGTT